MTKHSERMILVHQDSTKWYPALVKDNSTGESTYRVSKGAGANRKENTTFVGSDDEWIMHNLVLEEGYLVRCTNNAGGANMFGINKKSIVEVFLDGETAWKRGG